MCVQSKDKDRHLGEILNLTKQVTSLIDAGELLTYLGMKNDQRPDAASIKRYCACVWNGEGNGLGGGGGGGGLEV